MLCSRSLIFNRLVDSFSVAQWPTIGLRWPARELIDSADLLAFLKPTTVGVAFRSSAVVATHLILAGHVGLRRHAVWPP